MLYLPVYLFIIYLNDGSYMEFIKLSLHLSDLIIFIHWLSFRDI